MDNTFQTFLAGATRKAASNVVDAFLNLPEDRRNWQPAPGSRSAMDQLAECALNNGYTADLVLTRNWAAPPPEDYRKQKEDLSSQGFDAVKAVLDKNTERMVDVILSFPSDELEVEVSMPWGSGELSGVLAYPYWNMAYHEGQINYIASIQSLA